MQGMTPIIAARVLGHGLYLTLIDAPNRLHNSFTPPDVLVATAPASRRPQYIRATADDWQVGPVSFNTLSLSEHGPCSYTDVQT